MGVTTLYCNRALDASNNVVSDEREQLMLLRTLQDNESNIIVNNNRSPAIITSSSPKNLVSVINLNNQQQNENIIIVNNNNSQKSRQISQSQRKNSQNQNQNSTVTPYDPTRLKKHGKNGQPPPVAVARRNARERNRVKQVNNGFATLRQHIPSHVAQGYGDRGKKLSKVETLRMAVDYIKGLKRLLDEADGIIDFDTNSNVAGNNNPLTESIPSPISDSAYSVGTTHNGSGDVMCLTGELDEQHQQHQHQGETNVADEEDGDSYLMEEEDDDDERDRREKRFRENSRTNNRYGSPLKE